MTAIPTPRLAASTVCRGAITALSRSTSLPKASPKPPGSMKSRCMSITISAVWAGSKRNGPGSAGTVSWSAAIGLPWNGSRQHGFGGGDAAEDAALHGHHPQRRSVVAQLGAPGAVGQDQALVAPIVGLAHGGVHADIRGDAGQHDGGDAPGALHQIECGGIGRALA